MTTPALTELKAACYDRLRMIEVCQLELQELNKQIAIESKKQAAEAQPTDTEEKPEPEAKSKKNKCQT